MAHIFLPSDVMDDIDKLNVDLESAADTLVAKTRENSAEIRKVFNAVYVHMPSSMDSSRGCLCL